MASESAVIRGRGVIETSGRGKSPLLVALEEKVLADSKETKEPLSGLLYFLMEGKHKVKQLELHYRGPAGKLDIRFIEPK
jgi:hypothetical protein